MPAKVRDQRASATLWTMSPMWAGKRSFILSHCMPPALGRLPPVEGVADANDHRDQDVPAAGDEVGDGDDDPGRQRQLRTDPGVSSAISTKMFVKTGTTNAQTAAMTRIAITRTADGYIIAERTWRLSASSRSSWFATRSRASSRRPEPSPACTIER